MLYIIRNNLSIFLYMICMSYSERDASGILLESKLDYIFGGKENGFFIELGANDGLVASNTAYLEKERGWKGVLIEPSLRGYELCKINRPGSISRNYACVSNDYKGDYIYGDFEDNSLMGSVDGIRSSSNKITKVRASTLENILTELGLTEHDTIDLLSLDTEGYELNVLKGLNLKKYRPSCILVEVYLDHMNNIFSYLEEHRYRLHSNFTNYNKITNPIWDGKHNDFLFVDTTKTTQSPFT